MTRIPILLLISLSLFSLCACGQKQTTVILLPDTSGKSGAVVVQNQSDRIVMDEPYTYTDVTTPNGALAANRTDAGEVSSRFKSVLEAEPALPVRFILYFKTGATTLTPESKQLLPDLFEAAARRAPCEISIIGHTDTVGPADKNSRLSLERAQKTAALLKTYDSGPKEFSVQGFGEYDLLVPTPDETPEARNRRVELLIR